MCRRSAQIPYGSHSGISCYRYGGDRSADYRRLAKTAPAALRPILQASRWVLQTLLVRAYLYEKFYEQQFALSPPRVVITHNDFTTLSYLAGEAARRNGIPDFTLQHGFPARSIFPLPLPIIWFGGTRSSR